MELAIRGYIAEPAEPTPANWPTSFDPDVAGPITATLRDILTSCLTFAGKGQS